MVEPRSAQQKEHLDKMMTNADDSYEIEISVQLRHLEDHGNI